MNDRLTFYFREPCKEPRYPVFPTERPKFLCFNLKRTDDSIEFDFEDEESAQAAALYDAMGIEYELVFNGDKS